MSQNMKRPSLPSPAGSQARSIFSGGLFQVGTPDQLSTSLVSCRNFKIFQYTISTQCAYLFTIKLWQNKCGDMQNIGEKLGAGTVFLCFYTRYWKNEYYLYGMSQLVGLHYSPQFTTTQFCPWNTVAKEISLQILRVQHSTAGGTLGGVLRTIVLRRVLELGIRRVTTNFHNRRRHCLLFVKSDQHLHCHIQESINSI